MFEKLSELNKKAYAPQSNFFVSAIVVMKDGLLFNGVNVENASYGASICAERNAINAAIAAGYKKGDFSELHIMVSSAKTAYPCFVCRQTISEFCDNSLIIKLYNKNGEVTDAYYDELITFPFTEDNLI